MNKILFISATILFTSFAPQTEASLFFSYDFNVHEFDNEIKAILGFEFAAIHYFGEMGTISSDEKDIRDTWEPKGCYPFYLVKEGEKMEAGFNCMTFFCTGYFNNNIQCRDIEGVPVGSKWMDARSTDEYRWSFWNMNNLVSESDQSDEIREWANSQNTYKCTPFYLAGFGTHMGSHHIVTHQPKVIVGRGFDCSGQNSYYDEALDCEYNWETGKNSGSYDNNECMSAPRRKEVVQVSKPKPLSNETQNSDFIDVDSSHPYSSAITWARDSQVVQGYSDGSFKPDRSVNRAEFLKMILESNKAVDVSTATAPANFPDVDENAWYGSYIRYAKANGIVDGYSDGTFQPEKTVNFAEALKIAYRALDVTTQEQEGEWYSRFLTHARSNNVLFTNDVNIGSNMTRKDVVWIVWKLTQ